MNESSRKRQVSLLPIFRSVAQYRLMGELFTNPQREYSVGELAQIVRASHPTISKEVTRLAEAGLITTREQGRRRLVKAATDTPVYRSLRDLLATTYGVPAVVAEEFDRLDAAIVIFGSYAARWAGQPGPTPNDVDVLVIGDADPTEAWEAAARASQRLGTDVNVVVRDESEWANDPTGFAVQVRQSPVLVVKGNKDVNLASSDVGREAG